MKTKSVGSVLLAAVLLLGLLAGCGAPVPEPVKEYTVTFDPNGGELVSGELTQTVAEGASAVAPELQNGRMSLSWDKSFTGVTGNLTVKALWEKTAMSSVDLAEYVQERTVTVNVTDILGGESTGSGFFIDSEGTLITNYHVIDMAKSINVEVSSGGRYKVAEVVDFSNLYDMAVLKIDKTDTPYLELCADKPRTGEQVFAVGSALGILTGSFTEGMISSTGRSYGKIDCLQMTTPISSGNSGGPLVNVYGEVVGINTASYTAGENLNLAIKVSELKKLSMDKHWTVSEFTEWFETTAARSWSPTDYESYYYSLVNTYQEITDATCLYSVQNGEDGDIEEGYVDMYDYYVYEYRSEDYDKYIAYLKSIGFAYEGSVSEDDWEGTSYYYYNERDCFLLDLFILKDSSEIWIWPTLE